MFGHALVIYSTKAFASNAPFNGKNLRVSGYTQQQEKAGRADQHQPTIVLEWLWQVPVLVLCFNTLRFSFLGMSAMDVLFVCGRLRVVLSSIMVACPQIHFRVETRFWVQTVRISNDRF